MKQFDPSKITSTTYTWKDKLRWYWNDLILYIFIPKEYRVRHKILIRLYNQHRLTEQEQLSRDWQSSVMKLEDIPFLSLTLIDIKLHVWALIDSEEVSPLYYNDTTLVKEVAINFKGLSAVSTDKYIWEGVSSRVGRTKLLIAFLIVFTTGEFQLISKTIYLFTKLIQANPEQIKQVLHLQ